MKDSIGLLEAEIKKEEVLLAEEKKSLQEMDKNAKRAEAERKRQMKNVCEPIRGALIATTNTILQEHPVLRQLDELPRSKDQTSDVFTLLNTQTSQTALEEVHTFSGRIVRMAFAYRSLQFSLRRILRFQP